MRRTETIVLAVLIAMALCLFVGIGGFFVYDLAQKRGLLARAASPSTAPATVPVPPTPRVLPSAAPAPVAVQPTPRGPVPTNTLVVPREFVNGPLLQKIEKKMVSLRGLAPKQAVVKRFLTSEDLRQHLAALYSKDNSSQKVLAEQQLYSALGFIREGDDLNRMLRDLNARSMAGFYSSEEEELYIVSDRWNMSASEEMAFAHEFTHAMQDQYYNLKSLDDRAITADAHLAALSLIEGDATLSMALYAFSSLSQTDVNEIVYQAARLKPNEMGDIPLPLTQMTLFPYEAGVRFVQTIYAQRGWEGISATYAVPPLSTEQIMHIDKYFVHPDVPKPVALPAMDNLMAGSWREIEQGTLGEFLLGLHLEQGMPQAEALRAAAGWGGDTYSLLLDGEGRRLLVMRSVWDTPADAQKFFGAYCKLASRGGTIPKQIDEQGRAQFQWPDRDIYVSQHGSDALVVLAPDATSLNRAVYWFPGY